MQPNYRKQTKPQCIMGWKPMQTSVAASQSPSAANVRYNTYSYQSVMQESKSCGGMKKNKQQSAEDVQICSEYQQMKQVALCWVKNNK